MKKKNNNKRKKINKQLNDFIKKHKQQIVSNAKEDLGDISEKKIVSLFKQNFKEIMENKKETLKNARDAMQRTLHSTTFYGAKALDTESLKKTLQRDKAWEEFRRLNRHQKVNDDQFIKVSPPANTNIKNRWEYRGGSKTIYIDLLYFPDGSYAWMLHK